MKTGHQSQQGFSIVELMISMTIAIIMSLAVLQLFLSQSNQVRQESNRDLAAIETQALFETLARLLRQAQSGSIDIRAPFSINNTAIQQQNDALDIRFVLPDNYRIWPNDTADVNGIYSQNEIRLYWQNNNQLPVANHTLFIAWSVPGAIELAPFQALNNDTTPILNLDIWPLLGNQTPASSNSVEPAGGLLLSVVSRSPGTDPAFVNPNDTDGSFRHVRTHAISSIVAPRN